MTKKTKTNTNTNTSIESYFNDKTSLVETPHTINSSQLVLCNSKTRAIFAVVPVSSIAACASVFFLSKVIRDKLIADGVNELKATLIGLAAGSTLGLTIALIGFVLLRHLLKRAPNIYNNIDGNEVNSGGKRYFFC